MFDDSRPWRIKCCVDFRQDIADHGPSPSVGFSVDLDDEGAATTWVFDGCLTEGGNVLSGCYQFFDESRHPKHGHVTAICYANEIKGQFVGRNRKQSYGIVFGSFHAVALKSQQILMNGNLAAGITNESSVPIDCQKPR